MSTVDAHFKYRIGEISGKALVKSLLLCERTYEILPNKKGSQGPHAKKGGVELFVLPRKASH